MKSILVLTFSGFFGLTFLVIAVVAHVFGHLVLIVMRARELRFISLDFRLILLASTGVLNLLENMGITRLVWVFIEEGFGPG